MKKLFIVCIVLSGPLIVYAESDQILITISNEMEKINFDGKWSFSTEWKSTSQDIVNDGNVILRTAHQGDFIYVLIDNLSDITPGKKSDYSIICIDGKNDKSTLPDDNDYCFMAVLGKNNGFTYSGYSPVQLNGNFRKIPNDPDLIIIGDISDKNDRYSKIIHSSYEFKIPIKLVGRESTYGFYFSTYDSNQQRIYHWPESIDSDRPYFIPNPSTWGNLVSLDKSLPEFPLFLPILIISMIIVIGISKKLEFYRN